MQKVAVVISVHTPSDYPDRELLHQIDEVIHDNGFDEVGEAYILYILPDISEVVSDNRSLGQDVPADKSG